MRHVHVSGEGILDRASIVKRTRDLEDVDDEETHVLQHVIQQDSQSEFDEGLPHSLNPWTWSLFVRRKIHQQMWTFYLASQVMLVDNGALFSRTSSD